MDLKEAGLLNRPTNEHWYYEAKLNALKAVTTSVKPGLLLDVGAGSGFFSQEMVQADRMTSAICVDPGYEEETELAVAKKLIYFRKSVDYCPAKLILMMDVLEHVPDPVGLVKEYIDKVPSGTDFIITVPAFQFLWSEHDVFLEHYRRYTLPEIEEVLIQAGLKIKSGNYLYGLLFPAISSIRFLKKIKPISGNPHSDMKPQSDITNSLLSKICKIDNFLLKKNTLCGTTAMVHAVSP